MLTRHQRETLAEIPTPNLVSYVGERVPALVAAFYLPSNDPDKPLVCFMNGPLSDCIALSSCLQHKAINNAPTFRPDWPSEGHEG